MINAEVKAITKETLKAEVKAKIDGGNRFVTMTCVDTGSDFDIYYHFDLNYQLSNLQLKLAYGEILPSVAEITFPAVLAENEIKDFFGIEVSGLPIDYQGRFVLSENSPKAPLTKNCGMALDVRVKEEQ